MWGQIVTARGADEGGGLDDAFRNFRFSLGGWKVQAELPNPVNFTAASANVRPGDLAATIPAT